MNRNYKSDPRKWLIRKCGNHWIIWKPGHGVPDFHADTFIDILAGRVRKAGLDMSTMPFPPQQCPTCDRRLSDCPGHDHDSWDDPKYLKPGDCDENGYCLDCGTATVHNQDCVMTRRSDDG